MRTKIIATVGPASSSRDMLARLAEAGVAIFRLNFSHGDVAFFRRIVDDIRSIEQERGKPLTILQDLPGPKIRIGVLPDNQLTVNKGDKLILGPEAQKGDALPLLPFDNQQLLKDMSPEDLLVLADGGLRFRVRERLADGRVIIEARGTGIITSRKGLALPGKTVALPAITDKDRKNLAIGLELGVDAVAVSFVQNAADIRQAKALLKEAGRNLPVVAKLERRNAVDNLASILAETDMVMVARGDLGVECPLPELPALQKRIIRACNLASKPVIVATQMLLSMVSNPIPTRAETTDVANAVLDGADCVMMSEETAMGNYPVETVAYMRQITGEAENYLEETRRLIEPEARSGPPEFLAYAACLLAEKTGARALAAHSMSGSAARLLAACRPAQPIHALTTDMSVVRALNFTWGVQPHCVEENPDLSHLQRVQRFIDSTPSFPVGEDVVITAGEPSPGQPRPGTNLVKIYRK
ncbi:MAG: pyruvate kinase [Desulfovibrionaceae bacterium]|nr:pyruvate kinase [Desulfovibrionaceae bacterium]